MRRALSATVRRTAKGPGEVAVAAPAAPSCWNCGTSARATSPTVRLAAHRRALSTQAAVTSEQQPPPPAKDYIKLEEQYSAHNYQPIPVVLTKGRGVFVWDVDGKQYYDFLSAYSAVNQGHCHPRIIAAMVAQAQKLTLVSRAFHTDALGEFSEYACNLFGFDRVIMMNSGAEAGETAVKLARKWAYEKKGIADGKARVLFAENNFWGRTLAAVSTSADPLCYEGFGPLMPGFGMIPFNDPGALDTALSEDPNVCAFMVEPIQGEAGINVPDDGYMKKVSDICKKHNVLLIADEIQTGLGRTGRLLACNHDGVKPDVLVLGKALSGGTFPVSAVLASDEVMLSLKPGMHGSTYGGNPMACRVAIAALQVLQDDKMAENALALGSKFREGLSNLKSPLVETVRGRGLMNALVIKDKKGDGGPAWQVCLKLKDNGLLAKPTHGNIIRLAPPLCITESQLEEAVEIIGDTLKEF